MAVPADTLAGGPVFMPRLVRRGGNVQCGVLAGVRVPCLVYRRVCLSFWEGWLTTVGCGTQGRNRVVIVVMVSGVLSALFGLFWVIPFVGVCVVP